MIDVYSDADLETLEWVDEAARIEAACEAGAHRTDGGEYCVYCGRKWVVA